MNASEEVLEQLRNRLRSPHQGERETISCDVAGLARLLPDSAFFRGSLVEWETDGCGHRVIPLVLASLREAISAQRPLVVVDSRGTFFPAVAAQMGIPLEFLLLLRPSEAQETLWATEQALRCRGVGTVLCLGLEVTPRQTGTVFRRFQRAAEIGQTLGVFVRHRQAAGTVTWSDLRLRAEPQTTPGPTGLTHMQVRLTGGRCQGRWDSNQHREVRLVMDEWTGQITDETFRLPLAAPLASATLSSGLARA